MGLLDYSMGLTKALSLQRWRPTAPSLALSSVRAPRIPAEAKTEESVILVLARNGRHILGVIGPKFMSMHLMNRCLIGVYLTGVHLTGVNLKGVCLTGAYLMGMHLIGIHLIGMHLTSIYL
jgi:Pentapeptide repeats (8 copies)